MRINLELIRDLPLRDFEDYEFVPWNRNLIDQHAEAKFYSFCDELDSHVFPCLGQADGCLKLMKEICCRSGFVPQATWLLVHQPAGVNHIENCGTVQGIENPPGNGSIQNLGVANSHRCKGLGSALLIRSLQGFMQTGIETVSLEVTAQNEGALNLYKRFGFEIIDIVYKSIDLAY